MIDHRLTDSQSHTYEGLKHHAVRADPSADEMLEEASIDCGWGRIIMGHTFEDPERLASLLENESPGKRDIGLYVSDPHVVLSYAPQKLFLDPSDTFRLNLATYRPNPETQHGVTIRRIQTQSDARAIIEIYMKRDMAICDPQFLWEKRSSSKQIYLVAEDEVSGEIVGTVMGLNHKKIFNDPSAGSGLWCLAVDPQAQRPGVGIALVRYLSEYFQARKCAYMDLSVMHDNAQAIALYEKLGFQQIRTFAVKNKNAFNENLFVGPKIEEKINPYAAIIIDEARARGIHVDILDAEEGYFRLNYGGSSIVCRESLSELTSAIAMSRCQDKYVTYRTLDEAGIRTPDYQLAGSDDKNADFMQKHGAIVVKPAAGEQGHGISIGVSSIEELERSIELARKFGDRVLLESYHPGEDLRIVVIDFQVVAAAIRKPAQIIGDGKHDIETLIAKQSRRRQAATKGESKIPNDAHTKKTIEEKGYRYDSVLEYGKPLTVRKTANLHTGGTIHDVTSVLHPVLIQAAELAAKRLEIPVVGFDFMVKSPKESEYTFIEANERVGLANHEPQPTAERFIDLLFPLTRKGK